MNSFIENLNQLGEHFLNFAWPMLWQSSLLIALVLAVDLALARRIRASVRHALWLVGLIKLLLPPTLALPTGAAWWLFPAQPPVKTTATRTFVVTYGDAAPLPAFVPATVPLIEPPPPKLDRAGWTLLATGTASAGLLFWLLFRWGQVVRMVARAKPSGGFPGPIDEARRLAGLRGPVRVRIAEDRMSPAVCGLFRPVVLLPRTLADQLSAEQLRAVLLHEAIHIRRGDIWVNCAQALLQVAYWWQPLVWLANARIRRVREEAVDDAVMLALDAEAEIYAPTLLEVARLALRRPLLSLGLVGILESRSALRQRIERLLAFPAPRKAGLTLASICGIFVFSAVALPMGEGPARVGAPGTAPASPVALPMVEGLASAEKDMAADAEIRSADIPVRSTTSAQHTNPPAVLVEAEIYEMQAEDVKKLVIGLPLNPGHAGGAGWWSASPEEYSKLQSDLKQSGQVPLLRPRILTSSGQPVYIGTDQLGTEIACLPEVKGRQVDLAVNRVISAPALNNRFKVNAWLPDKGGLVFRMRNDVSNTVVMLRVEILTNHPAEHFQSRQTVVTEKPPSAEYNHHPLVWTGPGRQAIMAKLGNIHLGNVSYDGLPLSEVLMRLTAQCKLLDPEHKGITFLLNNNPDHSGLRVAAGSGAVSAPNLDPSTGLPLAPTAGTGVASDNALDVGSVIIKIPSLTDVRLADVLDAIILVADHPIKYSVQDFAVIFSARNPETPPLSARTFRVDPNTFDSGLDQVGAKSFGAVQNRGNTGGGGGAGQNQNNGAVVGVVNAFGAGGGSPSTSQNAGGSGRLDQAVPAAEPNEPGAQGQNRPASEDDLVRDGKVFYEMGKYGQAKAKFKAALALNQDSARANYYLRLINEEEARQGRKAAQDVSGRQQIASKLDHIRLANVSFDRLNLKEVVRQLNETARQNDPEKVGVHILIATNYVFSQWNTINSVIIRLPLLTEVRLADVLDAIAMVADKPLKYSIQDDEIIFSGQPTTESTQFFTRTFRVDSNTFYSGLINASAISGLKNASATSNPPSVLARSFFSTLGINFSNPPGKSVYFNDTRGYLFVKATESDLDTIEKALQVIDQAPSQVHIKARFYEVPNGTMKDFAKYLNTTSPVDGKPMGILTSQKANAARQALQSLKNVEVLGEPEITMLSGRQAQMRATEMVSVVTNVVFDAVRTNQSGKVEYNGVTPQTEETETGPVLDLIPYVLADGYTINLAAIPSVTEFVGFDWITNSSGYNYHYFSGNQPPKLRNTRYVATANLWDNQTLFLGGVQKRVLGRTKGFPDMAEDKELLVFITATIIDPAGSRVHSDDELPFAQDATPTQPQGQVNIPSSLLNPPAHIKTLHNYIGDIPPYHNGDPIHERHEGPGPWP